MIKRNPSNMLSVSPSSSGYFDQTERRKASSVSKSGGTSLMALCKDIAGTLIQRYQEESDSRKACDEVRAVLVDKLQCTPERAIAMIDLALELVRLNCYGKYRRNDLEMSLLVSRAAGHLQDVDRN